MHTQKHIVFLESNLSGSGFQGLKIAKELGMHVTFLTRDLERYLRVPQAKTYFDKYVDDIRKCETNEVEPILREIEKEAEQKSFDAFMTMGEYDIEIAARVAKHLGLLTLEPEAAAIARNKYLTRKYCLKKGIPAPRFIGARTLEECRQAVLEIGFPCIVKPADETSSVDVARCFTLEAAEEQFCKIKSKKYNTRNQKRFSKVLIEEYLIGYEVSVETITWQSQTHVIGVTDKLLSSSNNHFVELGHIFPSCLPTNKIEECSQVAKDALEAIGFNMGVAHTELKVTANGVKLIEINARPAGDCIPSLVEHSTGLPLLESLVRIYLGESPQIKITKKQGAAIRFLTAFPGHVQKIEGYEIAKEIPGVVDICLATTLGNTVYPLRRNGDRLGYAIAVADNSYEASRIAETAIQQISIEIQ